jgi:hypothetical protein
MEASPMLSHEEIESKIANLPTLPHDELYATVDELSKHGITVEFYPDEIRWAANPITLTPKQLQMLEESRRTQSSEE